TFNYSSGTHQCAPPFFYFCTMPCLTPKWKAFHYLSWCCSCLLPRALCWI
ncbi:hypothetical protein S245_006108, partial [Arachis hypogaea]